MRRRYRRHAGAKFRLLNEQFIELFDVDLASRMRPLEPLLQAARMAAWEGQEEGPSHTSCGLPARVAGKYPADGTAVASLVPTCRTRPDKTFSVTPGASGRCM